MSDQRWAREDFELRASSTEDFELRARDASSSRAQAQAQACGDHFLRSREPPSCTSLRIVYCLVLAIGCALALLLATIDRVPVESGAGAAMVGLWRERKMKRDFARRWCSGIATHPLWGTEEVAGICPDDHQVFFQINITAPEVDPNVTAMQFELVQAYLDGPNASEDPNYELYLEAFEMLKRLSQLKPVDIFAFRETWTDEDTKLLMELDRNPRTWVRTGNITTAFAQRLPSIVDFTSWVARSPLAVVGGADSIANMSLGSEIDEHRTVARFNDIVGNKLDKNETGVKLNLHVACSKVAPLGNEHILEFDLETYSPWRSYCGRLHDHGEFAGNPGKPLLIRPAAHCHMLTYYYPMGWTRGFLFYWFIARLFDEYDMYGFRGSGHYKNDEPMRERYFRFEHLFYDIIEPNRH